MTPTPLSDPALAARPAGRGEPDRPADRLVALAAGLIAGGGSDATAGVRALLRHVHAHDPAALERMVAEIQLQRLGLAPRAPATDRRPRA